LRGTSSSLLDLSCYAASCLAFSIFYTADFN
jgi:hypothetical protein